MRVNRKKARLKTPIDYGLQAGRYLFRAAVARFLILFLLMGVILVSMIVAVNFNKLELRFGSHESSGVNDTNQTSATISNFHVTGTSSSRLITTYSKTDSLSSSLSSASSLPIGVNEGNEPPNFPIDFVNGTHSYLYSFLGTPILLWFVTTWCSSCQQSAQMLKEQYYQQLESKGVVILTIELYDDLNQNGPNLTQFAQNYGAGVNEPNWYYGYSNQTTTYVFDPEAALDVYYAINSHGVIVAQGIGLPNALPAMVSDSSWLNS
jgi:thiol-disulfide isomerase/thioredoxin